MSRFHYRFLGSTLQIGTLVPGVYCPGFFWWTLKYAETETSPVYLKNQAYTPKKLMSTKPVFSPAKPVDASDFN